MEPNQQSADSLNSSQKLHLLTSCQHADKLFSEIESILVAAASKSPFPKFKADILPAQAKVVQDYIARIRAQMLRVLDSQGIQPPEPQFGSVHSVRVTLGFAGIAFDECRAKSMLGYGEVADSAVPELDGLVDELKGLIAKLDAYLAQGLGQDLQSRLEKLQEAGSNLNLVRALERVIDSHGLVEFRPTLANIVGRLESATFEIAVFGRVSSGKSSLLNHVLQKNVLPVGVTPVTAVPTRIVCGPLERAVAWFADRSPMAFEIERLPEFATEQFNPANWKHVTKIVVEVPSSRLRDGLVYVDTPGLGSLATAGAVETMAYLPRCDLGIVLIDAGSALTADDISTMRTLYEAAIPAFVLLSKSDLLAADDQERVRQYIGSHIRSELGLNLPVHPVSIRPGSAELLERWFEQEILPLYDRHVELSRESLYRKIGALRAGVEATLRSRLGYAERVSATDGPQLRMLEVDLRKVAGRFAEIRTESLRITDEIRESSNLALRCAAEAIVDAGSQEGTAIASPAAIACAVFEQVAAQKERTIVSMLRELAHDLAEVLAGTAAGLAQENAPHENDLITALKDMPRLDTGILDISIRPGKFAIALGKTWAVRRAERRLQAEVGGHICAAFSSHGKVLEAWVRRTLTELQARFDSYADAYRAQLDGLITPRHGTVEDEEAIRRDLAAIGDPGAGEMAEDTHRVRA